MIFGEILNIFHFYHFDSDPTFPPFLLYARWKSGVTFIRRCFRDDINFVDIESLLLRAKFQTSDFEEDTFQTIFHIRPWLPFWSCDLNHLYTFCSSFTKRFNMKFGQTVLE